MRKLNDDELNSLTENIFLNIKRAIQNAYRYGQDDVRQDIYDRAEAIIQEKKETEKI